MRLATSGPTLSISPAPSPVVLAGDYNVVPTDRDIYAVRSYADDALLQAAPRAQLQKLLRQGPGWS
jgi:exodeoxyribonuclease-3